MRTSRVGAVLCHQQRRRQERGATAGRPADPTTRHASWTRWWMCESNGRPRDNEEAEAGRAPGELRWKTPTPEGRRGER
jgi:hypothetical protein